MKSIIRVRVFFLFLLFVAGCASTPTKETALPAPFYGESHIAFAKWKRDPGCCTATGSKMAIASGGTHSSKAGLEIAAKGGNLVDAAVATAFALAVERPFSAGLGGGGFLTLRLKSGKNIFVDFRESAPAKASRDMYLDTKGNVVADSSVYGPLAVATPGFVAGLYEVHKKWGKLPWARVLQPAIRLAKEGFPAYPSLVEKAAKNREVLSKQSYIKELVFGPSGEPLKEGQLFRQPDLAKTLGIIAKKGAKGFYEGPVAKAIVDLLKAQGGILDGEDLRKYQVKYREPVKGNIGEFTFVSAPPPSAGGVLFVQMLNVLSTFDLSTEAKAPAGYAHLLSQVMKRAYADRSRYIGDPDFVQTGYPSLMKLDYAATLRQKIDLSRNTPSKEIAPGQYVPGQAGTTQFSLIDAEGNAAAGTMTINGSWGAALAVPGTGIILNNEMDDFSTKPGEANIYGLTGGNANAIAPDKRPVSSMTPTILLRKGVPVLAVGGAGGSRIISSVFQTLLNYAFIFPADPKRAVFAPRVHHQWLPDRIDLEAAFSDETRALLAAKGHEVAGWPWTAQVQAAGFTSSGELMAVFDPRDEGGAAAR